MDNTITKRFDNGNNATTWSLILNLILFLFFVDASNGSARRLKRDDIIQSEQLQTKILHMYNIFIQ